MTKILEFQGDYRFLSNFYICSFTWDGIKWSHSEAAYQAAKTLDRIKRLEFSTLTASESKRRGKSLVLRSDWEEVKVEVLAEILYAKFSQNPYLKQQLIDTKDAILIEGNSWGDRFWGVSPTFSDNGLNHLGRLLMELRTLFQLEEKYPTANAEMLESLRNEQLILVEDVKASIGGLVSF